MDGGTFRALGVPRQIQPRKGQHGQVKEGKRIEEASFLVGEEGSMGHGGRNVYNKGHRK